MRPGTAVTLGMWGCLMAAVLAAADGAGPVTVSPGSVERAVIIPDRCPTFSWGAVAGERSYELAVYRIEEGGETERVLTERLSGAASSWTPDLARCLDAGDLYAWSVRGLGDDQPHSWSTPRLFRIAGPLGEVEVREAVRVLRRFLAEEETSRRSPENPPTTRLGPGLAERALPRERLEAPPAEAIRADDLAVFLPVYSLSIDRDLGLAAGSHVLKEGQLFLHDDASPGVENLGVGRRALEQNTVGYWNTGVGTFAMQWNNAGDFNTALGSYALHANVDGGANTAVGTQALRRVRGSLNTAVGQAAMAGASCSPCEAFGNTAVGSGALLVVAEADYNTAVGVQALGSNHDAEDNTAVGYLALGNSFEAFGSTALGSQALRYTESGSGNVAVGWKALQANVAGYNNTALGTQALKSSLGNDNIAVGNGAGVNLGFELPGAPATSLSQNIYIGHTGMKDEEKTLRIGDTTKQTRAFVAGIRGAAGSFPDGVCIDANHQLGMCSTSSRRFKEEIGPLAGASEGLLAMRPVRFRYKEEVQRGDRPVVFGLIAEEVAELFPQLVGYDEEGRPSTVRYHLFTPLLLEQLQRQHRELAKLQAEVVELRRLLAEGSAASDQGREEQAGSVLLRRPWHQEAEAHAAAPIRVSQPRESLESASGVMAD